MKTKNLLLVIFGTISITAIGISIGYFVFQEAKDDDSSSKQAPSPAKSTGGNGLMVIENGTSLINGTSDPTNTASQSGPSQVAGPESFGDYDQFIDSTDLRYQEIVVGSGDVVGAGDTVAVVYSGWLTDGKLFDQSSINEEGQIMAFSFQLGAGQVIQGWEQGISGMNVGGKRRLIVPPALAYGEAGKGAVPSNALLVFDVEIVNAQAASKKPVYKSDEPS